MIRRKQQIACFRAIALWVCAYFAAISPSSLLHFALANVTMVPYGGGDGYRSKCTATFSIPQAGTYTISTTQLPNLPEYSPKFTETTFTYYRISSVDLSRAGDLTINVALAGGTINTTFSVMDAGVTELPLLSATSSGVANGVDELKQIYASVYARYLSFGQFADAATQAKTNLEQLKAGVFSKEGGSEVAGGGKFLVSAKSRLIGALLVPADYIDVSNDYDSLEGHGVADVVFKKYGRIEAALTPNFMSITLRSFSSYRIANDEYVYFNFFNNLTDPPGCMADETLVLHITGFQSGIVAEITSFTCFVVMVVGLVVVIFGTIVPTSHHAGAIGMLVISRFAHEDGQPLSFVVSPLQASIGTDKYQYVMGSLVGNVCVLIGVAVFQLITRSILKYKYLPSREAAGVARWPFLSIAFFAHFSPQIFFTLGRLLGRIEFVSLSIASVAVLLMTSAVIAMAKKVLSANDNFGAYLDTSATDSRRYRRMLKTQDQQPRPEFVGTAEAGKLFGARELSHDKLLDSIPIFGGMFKSKGVWVARQPVNFLLERWGYLFIPYRKKHWVIIEFGDAMICGLVSVLDNYTSALAMYQYGIFTVSKLLICILIILIRPGLKPLDTNMMLLSYGGQLLACIALFVGSIKAQLLDAFSMVKDVSLLFCAIILCIHILLATFESVRNFYRRVKDTDARRKAFELERQKHAYVNEVLEHEANENDAMLEEAARGRGQSVGSFGGQHNASFYNLSTRSAGGVASGGIAPYRSNSVETKKPRRLLKPFGVQEVESGLFETLVEGNLPGTIATRQVEIRNLKFDSRNVLPAQEAFKIHNDGSITFDGGSFGGVGRAYDGFTVEEEEDSDAGEKLTAEQLRQARRNGTLHLYNAGRKRRQREAVRLRELKTPQGTIMIEPVYSTWGIDSNSSGDDSGDGDSYYDDRNSGVGGASVGAGSRRGAKSSRFGGKSVLNSGPTQSEADFAPPSSEDSDSNYDSEGLPIASVEQRIRRQNRRAARAKRRADKKMMQQGVMDADGEFLVDDDTFMSGTMNGGVGELGKAMNGERSDEDGGVRGADRQKGVAGVQPQTYEAYDPSTYQLPTTRTFAYSTIVKKPIVPNTAKAMLVASGRGTSASALIADPGGKRQGLTVDALTTFDAHNNLPTAAGAGAGVAVDKEGRKRMKAQRRREKREQKCLSKGIVTSTANLCKQIPNGGVNIEQFYAFVDSIPNLSHEERSRHKRKLVEKLRTIYRDRAREAANKKMQERIKSSLAIDNESNPFSEGGPASMLNSAKTVGSAAAAVTSRGVVAAKDSNGVVGLMDTAEHSATGLHEMRLSRQIQIALQMGGVRGMHFVKEATAHKAELAAEAARKEAAMKEQAEERRRMLVAGGGENFAASMALRGVFGGARQPAVNNGAGGGADMSRLAGGGPFGRPRADSIAVSSTAGGDSQNNRRVVGRMFHSDGESSSTSGSGSDSSVSSDSMDETTSADGRLAARSGQRPKIDRETGELIAADDQNSDAAYAESQYDESDMFGDRLDDTASAVSYGSRHSKYSAATSRASRRSNSTRNTLKFNSSNGGNGQTAAGRNASNSAAGDGSGGRAAVRRKPEGMSDADFRLEEEIRREKQINNEFNGRLIGNRATAAGAGGGGAGGRGGGGHVKSRGGSGRHSSNGGTTGLDHGWLVLDDSVQATAALYAARMIDTLEAATSTTATAQHSNGGAGDQKGHDSTTAAVNIPASPARHAVDVNQQRFARQTGTLIAVWESIGTQVKNLASNDGAGAAKGRRSQNTKELDRALETIAVFGSPKVREDCAPSVAGAPQPSNPSASVSVGESALADS